MDRILLDDMSYTTKASYRSGDRPGCMRGTRRGVLKQLEDWLHDEQGNHLLLLHGNAGTGKSAIAQTFAEMTFADGILGASFFALRGSMDRRDAQFILPTLAFHITELVQTRSGQIFPRMARYAAVWPTGVCLVTSCQTGPDQELEHNICPPRRVVWPDIVRPNQI